MPNDLPEGYTFDPRPELIDAQVQQESGGRANPPDAGKGAVGLMQIEPATAKAYGFDPSRLRDATYNRTAGTGIMRSLLTRHGGDEREALKSWYGRGKSPAGQPTADEYADGVLKRIKPAKQVTPASDLPEGYKLDPIPEGYKLDSPTTADPGDQALRADPRVTPGEIDPFKVITEGAKFGGRIAQIAAPLIASLVAPEFLPESIAGIPLSGEAVTAAGRGAGYLGRLATRVPGMLARSAAFAGGYEGGKVATGQTPDLSEAAKNLGFGMAFEGPGAAVDSLRGAAAGSPAASALLDKAASAVSVGPRTARIADHIVNFFKDVSGKTPEELATLRQSADEGTRIANTARKPLDLHRTTIQSELRGNLGDAAEARVPRSTVKEPIGQILQDPERAAGLSPAMRSFTSEFAQAKPATPLEARIAEQMKAEGVAGRVSNLGKGYNTKFEPGSGFFSQPDYSVDELTHIRSKIGQVAQDGNWNDHEVDQFVSDALGKQIEQQMTEHGATTAQIAAVDHFFSAGGKWAAYKQMEQAFKLSATGQIGIAQADKVWKVAKSQPDLFNEYLDWAQRLEKEHPEANVMPTLREAYLLRLSRIAADNRGPGAARDAIKAELDSLDFEHASKVFGRNSPITDSNAFAEAYGMAHSPAAKDEAKAVGEKIARRPYIPRYFVAMGIFVGAKALLGVRGRGGIYSGLLGGGSSENAILAAGSLLAAYAGPSMARAIMSYGAGPLQRAYIDWLRTPNSEAALSKFGRMLQGAVGAGQGYIAGSGVGHPYLGAAIGAVLRGAKVPGTEPETPAAAAPGGPAAPPLTGGPRPNLSRGTGLGNRLQGFERVGGPYTPPSSQSMEGMVFDPSSGGYLPRVIPTQAAAPQLPAVRNDPKPPLAWLKQKAAPIPRFELHRPAPLKNGSATPLLPTGTVAGPEGPGQFVARPGGGEGTPTAKPVAETASRVELNTDFRKMRLDPNPTRFESNASALGRNPERWQFKEANVKGLTDALSGVKHYDAVQGGDLIAYYDPATEKLEVIDGHQRHYLAQNDQDSRVPYFVLDGGSNFKGALAHNVTPGAARAYAAVRNLRAGTGSSLDVAKFVRDAGLKIDDLKELNVPLSGSQMKDGLALSKLDDQVFREVAMRRFPERLGIVLGTELADEPAVQTDLMKQIRADEDKGEAISPADLAEWIKIAKGAETQQLTMTDMFGERQVKQSNFKEMGQLSRFIMGDLKKDTTVFKYAGKHAERLAKGNTAVDVETGTKLSTDAANRLMMYRRVAYEPESQTRKILSDAAWEMKRNVTAARRNAIRRDAYREIQKVLPEDFDRAIGATRTSEAQGIPQS